MNATDKNRDNAVTQSIGIAFRFLSLAVGALCLLWLFSGFTQIESGSRAVIVRFGAIDRVREAGLAWALPKPFEEVVRVAGRGRQLTQVVDRLDVQGTPMGYELDPRSDGGLVLTGDAGVVHVRATVTYEVSDPALYVLASERLAQALDRLFCAATIQACAGRTLDGVVVARAGSTAADAESRRINADDLARRDSLRGEIVTRMNRGAEHLALGIAVMRIDLSTQLPERARPAFDQVLSAEAEAAEAVASARTYAASSTQQAQQDRNQIIASAQAGAQEQIARAHIATDRITAVMAESSPQRRSLLIARLYRDRIDAILKRAEVTLIDGSRDPNLIVPGDAR